MTLSKSLNRIRPRQRKREGSRQFGTKVDIRNPHFLSHYRATDGKEKEKALGIVISLVTEENRILTKKKRRH